MNQHAGAFSPDRKFFANISDDGKLKVWDVETNELKHDYATSIVNSSPCTCLTWITLKHGLSKKSRRSTISGQDFLALGTTTGSVLVFSLSAGKVEHTLKGDGHMGGITSSSWDKTRTLYTSGEDCKVIVWDLEKGSSTGEWATTNERLTCISCTASGEGVITASRQVRLWDPSTRVCQQTFTGHTSTVTHVCTFTVNGAEYAISAAKMDRNVSMWSLDGGKKQKDAVATFIVDDLVNTLDATVHEGAVHIVASTRNGLIHIFTEAPEKILNSVKPIKTRWRMSIVTDNRKTAESLPIVSAKFTPNGALQLAYGASGCIRFEVVTPKRKEKHEVLIRDDPRKVKSGKDAPGKHILVDPGKVNYALGGEGRKTMKTIEIPMEKRLENLMLSKEHTAGGVMPTKNMHYLIQALHSRDPIILQDVLLTKDRRSIKTTLKYLPPQYIRPLIGQLTLFMQQKIKNIECATVWMQMLIQLHVSQLMAVGAEDLRDELRPFLGIVEHRVANLQALTRVRGRLDLILMQIEGNATMDSEEIAKINRNLIVHQDKGSDTDSDIGLEDRTNASSDSGWKDSSDEEGNGAGEAEESEESDEEEENDQEMGENDEEMEVSD
uniref:Putative wd40 domain protein n=1 Tax=Lutzomyia longipalpis TaxID=7200 RepID=A0A7G3B859_LUTLO